MTPQEREAIRARDASGTVYQNGDVATPAGVLLAGRAGNVEWHDRRALLKDYDALAAAARKVVQFHDKESCQCVYCADLRKLLEGER